MVKAKSSDEIRELDYTVDVETLEGELVRDCENWNQK
jgi:hypothetical protein